MYSAEESKKIREEFWNKFKAWSGGKRIKLGKPGKWIMNETGIKQIRLKFHFDEQYALAGLEIDTRNLDKRLELWERLESLKTRLQDKLGNEIIWEIEYPLETGKTVSRVYSKLENVDIYDRTKWPQVYDFLYSNMLPLEEFFTEYKDYLKCGG